MCNNNKDISYAWLDCSYTSAVKIQQSRKKTSAAGEWMNYKLLLWLYAPAATKLTLCLVPRVTSCQAACKSKRNGPAFPTGLCILLHSRSRDITFYYHRLPGEHTVYWNRLGAWSTMVHLVESCSQYSSPYELTWSCNEYVSWLKSMFYSKWSQTLL